MQLLNTLRLRCRDTRDHGMSTAEYAVGTVAAAAFAGLLFKILTSPEVRRMLLKIIQQARSATPRSSCANAFSKSRNPA